MSSKYFDNGKLTSWLGHIKDDLNKFLPNRIDDVAQVNLEKDVAASQDLGDGDDVVLVKSSADQVRLTFTSAEVGNGVATDANTMANQDGGLAVRVQ